MKHQSIFFLWGSLMLVLLLTAGGLAAAANPLQEPQSPSVIPVGLVLDETGMAMGTHNWLSDQGLQRAVSNLGVVGTVYAATSSAEYEATLQECVDETNTLCITVGIGYGAAVENLAAANPATLFAIVDWTYENYPANLRGITFDYDQMGYLAGSLAGLMSTTNNVGDIGGPNFVTNVVRLVERYRTGAMCANPFVYVQTTYLDSFVDPDAGAAAAQEMIARGADVIFAAAGPTGDGAVLSAAQSSVWAIGVDADNYHTVFDSGAVDGAEYLLSSTLKKIDNVVYRTIEEVVNTTFTAGTVVYGLAEDAIGMAPYHESESIVPQSVKDEMILIEQALLDDMIDMYDPCREYLYLPAINQGD
jgi:basic membrane protein A and related proteins